VVKAELERRKGERIRDRWLVPLRRFGPPAIGSAAALLALYLGAVGVSGAARVAHPRPFDFPDRPENYGMAYEAVRFPAAVDNLSIAGWLFADPGKKGRLVVVVPGYRSHKAHMLREYTYWLAQSYGVLAIDPRGSGESGRAPFSFGDDERRDVAGAVAFARSRGYRRVAVFGTSAGGAAAISEAAHDPAVQAVISDGAPASVHSGLSGYLAGKRYPLPGLGALAIMGALSFHLGHVPAGGDVVRHVAALSPRPLLLIHGTRDHVIPVSNVGEIARAADSRRTAVLTFAEADHMSEMDRSPHRLYRAAYEGAVLELLRRALL
jgi:pimeloyl-ACP methyl ester carboxylesterase